MLHAHSASEACCRQRAEAPCMQQPQHACACRSQTPLDAAAAAAAAAATLTWSSLTCSHLTMQLHNIVLEIKSPLACQKRRPCSHCSCHNLLNVPSYCMQAVAASL